jgi:hypothetical protein
MTQRLLDLSEREPHFFWRREILRDEPAQYDLRARRILPRNCDFRQSQNDGLAQGSFGRRRNHRREDNVGFSKPRQSRQCYAGVVPRVRREWRGAEIQSTQQRQSAGEILGGNRTNAFCEPSEDGRFEPPFAGRCTGNILHEPVLREIRRERCVTCRGELRVAAPGRRRCRTCVLDRLLRAKTVKRRNRTHDDENEPVHWMLPED